MKNRHKGTALVEFALVLPLLLILTLITTEFGRAMYQYNTLTKSVGDAVRYLSTQTPGSHTAEARNMIVYGNLAGTGSPQAPGLSLSNVPVPTWQATSTNPVINTVTVQVTGYTFVPMIPSIFSISFGSIPFTPISATMRSPL